MENTNDSDGLDLEAIAAPWKPSRGPVMKAKRESNVAPYLRGPIPWWWLHEASSLGAGTLATGLAVWHLRALNKSETFTASLYQLRKWTGLSEKVTRQGLHRLEAATLVMVERPRGRSPKITLLHKSIEKRQTARSDS